MAYVEQIVFSPGTQTAGGAMPGLARSPGMDDQVAREVIRLCGRCCPAPEAAPIARPESSLMSFSLASTMSSLPGRLYAVVKGGLGNPPLMHAVVLQDGSYVRFGRNPYAVARKVEWRQDWLPGMVLDRIELWADQTAPLIEPLPDQKEAALVQLCLQEILACGRLVLPLDRVSRESDRCLALVIAGLPDPLRKDLRFCSFTTGQDDKLTLAARQVPGAAQEGWKRFLLSLSVAFPAAEVEAYLDAVRPHLLQGDAAGLLRVTQRHPWRTAGSTAPATPGVCAPTRMARTSRLSQMSRMGPRPLPRAHLRKRPPGAPARTAKPAAGRQERPWAARAIILTLGLAALAALGGGLLGLWQLPVLSLTWL